MNTVITNKRKTLELEPNYKVDMQDFSRRTQQRYDHIKYRAKFEPNDLNEDLDFIKKNKHP